MKPENMLKGRMAESLVEELLKQCDNKVYRFGYEAILQDLTQLEKAFDREGEVGQRISSIPDFIVVNQKKILFVEVKFRTDLTVYLEDIRRMDLVEKFWKAKIILLTTQQPYFRVSNSPYLNKEQEWNWIPLKEDPDFEISDDILKQFNELVEKYYIAGKNKK